MMLKWLWPVIAWLPTALWAADQVPVPTLRAPVTDLTQTLSADQISTLDAQLRALQTRKGSQLAILLVPTTQPETIEQYALRVADTWKLGRAKPDDGVLLVVAKQDRTVRIEVGYGLEGVLTDAATSRIIREWIVPAFRAGSYYQGLSDASTRIIQLIDGEALPAPEPVSQPASRGNGSNLPWPLLIFGVVAAGSVLRSVLGRLGAAGVTAGGAGLLVWLFAGSIVMALMVGLFALIFVLGSGGRGGWPPGGGWSSGPRGGGWGGGFGGGGGFSGGGGGFGGGGASGRW